MIEGVSSTPRIGDMTGKKRHRHDWRGRLILQVEVYGSSPINDNIGRADYTRWRDARIKDFSLLEVK